MYDINLNGCNAINLFENSEEILSESKVEEAISKVAMGLERDVAKSLPIMVTVMGGAVIFAGKLLPLLSFPLECQYVSVSRYGNNKNGGELIFKQKIDFDVKDRTIVLLDDILDEGTTLSALKEKFLALGAKEVKCAVWFDKLCKAPNRQMQSDWYGAGLPDKFVFGCGMDIEGFWRNLPHIRAI